MNISGVKRKMASFDLFLSIYGLCVILVMVYIAYKGDKKK